MPVEALSKQREVGSSAAVDGSFDPARRAFLNGCVNFARGLLSVVFTVILTPFLVAHLGLAGFGVWSLLGVFITYITLVDLGISGATAKFVGGLSPSEDAARLNRFFTGGMAVTAGIALATLLLVYLFRNTLETDLGAFGLFGADAKVFLVGAAALYSVGIVSSGLSYVLLGLHRLDVANYIAASVLLVQAVGTVVVLEAGLGLPGLVGLMTGAAAVSIVAYFVAVRKLAPSVRFHWKDFNFITVRELFTFGVYLQAYGLVCVYYIYMGKAVVSLRFPLAAVAAYEVALRLPVLFRQGISTMLGPMMPAVAHLDARGGSQQVKSLLLKALRYSLLLGAPVFVGVAVFAGPVIQLWVGPGFSISVMPLRILSVAFGLGVFPDLVWYFLVGLGRHRVGMIFSLLQVIFGTFLSYRLSIRWALSGVAIGVFLTSLLGVLLYAALLVREELLSWSDLPVRLACKVSVIASGAYLIVFVLARRFQPTYWNLSLAMFLGSTVYILWLMKAGVLEGREKLFLRGHVPSYLHFLC
jgi:O-antigen/teichoic acid export membrane protein